MKARSELVDDRSMFANHICDLIVRASGSELSAAIASVAPIYDYFFEHVRNIYELVDEEIPLFWLYELRKHGADNWDYSEDEYRKVVDEVEMACFNYYPLKR